MVQAMLLGGLRRCEVLGLRLGDVRPGERRLFIVEGKGGHQRLVPVSPRFFTALAAYLELERPRTSSTDRVFVVLKGGRLRPRPTPPSGLNRFADQRDRKLVLASSVQAGRPRSVGLYLAQ